MSETKNRKRQPGGAPDGGEYAREAGRSTGIDLGTRAEPVNDRRFLADAVRRDDPELADAEKRNTLILATMRGTVASGQVGRREPLSDPVAEEFVSGWEKTYRRAARPRLLDRLVGGEARAARREARLQDAMGEYHGIKATVERIEGAFDHEIRSREAQERGLPHTSLS